MSNQPRVLQFWTKAELQCKCGCGTLALMPGFLTSLVALQEACNIQLLVNSCCRCPAHNNKVGGHPRSLHLTSNPARNIEGTCAIDLRFPEDHPQRKLVWDKAWELGWSIGNNPRFIHLDRRTEYIKFPQTIFRY